MAAPLVLSFWMRSLFTFVDTAYAAWLGDAAVAAIGLTIPLEFLMISCWVGVSNGLTSCLSQAMGARQGARIDQLLATTRRIAWSLVPVFAVIAAGTWYAAPRLGLDPEVARQFAIYSGVLIGGSAFTAFWSILPDSIVKAHHDTRSTMWAGIWSNTINVVLNTIFVFVFHWGILGIALSTVIGRFGGLVYALRKSAAHEAARKAGGLDTDPTLDPRPLRSILALALPAALSYALMALESTVVNFILARQPEATASIAAYGIYYRVVLFAVMPIIATSVAILPFVARRFGAGDLPGIRRAIRRVFRAAVGYSALVVAPAMALGGPALARLLSEAESTTVLTRAALYLTPIACLASIPFFICRPAFEGLRRGRPGLVVTLLRYVVLTGPCAWIGVRAAAAFAQPALYGLLVGLIVASGLASAFFHAWFDRTMRTIGPPGPGREPG
jgi:putative MATE family efflux protein